MSARELQSVLSFRGERVQVEFLQIRAVIQDMRFRGIRAEESNSIKYVQFAVESLLYTVHVDCLENEALINFILLFFALFLLLFIGSENAFVYVNVYSNCFESVLVEFG